MPDNFLSGSSHDLQCVQALKNPVLCCIYDGKVPETECSCMGYSHYLHSHCSDTETHRTTAKR